jgi:serine/threonine-protein kinase HipA
MGSGMVSPNRVNASQMNSGRSVGAASRNGNRLQVLMNGIRVGQLTKLPTGAMTFQYDRDWLTMPGSRPISLSLPLGPDLQQGAQVYNFFDNLLPDSDRTRAKIQARFQISSRQPFDLLAAIGGDCVGAIQLYPVDQIPTPIAPIQAEPLSIDAIAAMLSGNEDAPLGMIESTDDFRISIAGAQEKTALLWYQDQWCRPLGATATSHIFKLPIGVLSNNNIDLRDSCENEWLCLEIAKAFGLPTASAKIQRFNAVKVLVVERFDRRWSQDSQTLLRLPQEDFCQALGRSPSLKYQADGGPGIAEIMQILLGSEDASHDREQFFRSQILFWLLAATDGHGKNFSLYLEADSRYRLTPLYDILSTYPLMKSGALPKQKAKMAMALRGKKNYYEWNQIQSRHFSSTAKFIDFSVARAEQVVEEMLGQVETIVAQVEASLPQDFPRHIKTPIFEGMIALATSQRQ